MNLFQGTDENKQVLERLAVDVTGGSICVRESDRCKIKILLLFPFERTR